MNFVSLLNLFKMKNKKSQAGVMVMGRVIKWLILFALLLFAIAWYTGLGSKITNLVKSIF